MKARVKATGEIVDVRDCGSVFYDGAFCHGYVDINRNKYLPQDLEFEGIDDAPQDYWTRLEHQYAGMAMQGILSCPEWNIVPRDGVSHAQECALQAKELAHALVEKMKEERE